MIKAPYHITQLCKKMQLVLIILACTSLNIAIGQSSNGMITPFSIQGDFGSGFVGDIVVSEDSGFVNTLSIVAGNGVTVSVIDESDNAVQFEIYPNPTSEILTIHSTDSIDFVEIVNTRGQVVLTAKKEAIDISHLQTGVYHLSINRQSTLTFIKQ